MYSGPQQTRVAGKSFWFVCMRVAFRVPREKLYFKKNSVVFAGYFYIQKKQRNSGKASSVRRTRLSMINAAELQILLHLHNNLIGSGYTSKYILGYINN